MKILALETSTATAGVALADLNQIYFSESWVREKSHSERVTAIIEIALKTAALTSRDLTAIAINIGPGSFTGIRLGLSIAKALAYALEIPVIPCTAHDVVAIGVPAPASTPNLAPTSTLNSQQNSSLIPTMTVCLNAFRNLIYWCEYEWREEGWASLTQVAACTWGTLPESVIMRSTFVGSGLDLLELEPLIKSKFKILNSEKFFNPTVENLVRLAQKRLEKGTTSDWKSIEALYVRGSEAEEKLRSGLLKPFINRST